MYRVPLKTAVIEAIQNTLLADPHSEWGGFRPGPDQIPKVYVGMEFPLEQQHYPGIWVQYDDREPLRVVGIGYREYVADDLDPALQHEITRWRFSGTITLTIVALTSMERDRLFDEIVRLYAFAAVEQDPTTLRARIENHDLIGLTLNWDELRPAQDSAAPGTPWGTEDDVIYEQSLSFDVVVGEFYSTPASLALVPLSRIDLTATEVNDDGDPVREIQSHVDGTTETGWSAPL